MRKLHLIDVGVLVAVVFAMLIVPAALVISDLRHVSLETALDGMASFLNVMAMLACVLLLVWIFSGKCAVSPLWSFMPPFCLLPFKSRFEREGIAFALAAVTAIGVIGRFLGLVQ